MATSTRLRSIRCQNAELKKMRPYAFCDRWCKRCPIGTQHSCWFYLIDFERRITNIANGKDPNEINVKDADVKNACERIEHYILQLAEERGIDLVEFDGNINKK